MSDPPPKISREVLDQGQQWSAERVAAEIGRSVGELKSLRKRGQFPSPDGHLGRVPWWHPSSVQDWLQNQQLPPAAVVGRQAAARTLQITITQLDTYELPPTDGTRHGHSWWLTSTLHTWAGRVFADVLVTVDQVHVLVGCSDEEWPHLQDELPAPFLVGPEPWWPKQIRAVGESCGLIPRCCSSATFLRCVDWLLTVCGVTGGWGCCLPQTGPTESDHGGTARPSSSGTRTATAATHQPQSAYHGTGAALCTTTNSKCEVPSGGRVNAE